MAASRSDSADHPSGTPPDGSRQDLRDDALLQKELLDGDLKDCHQAIKFLQLIRQDCLETAALNQSAETAIESTFDSADADAVQHGAHNQNTAYAGPSSLPCIGRFQIERTIGRGGFSEVYLARDPGLNRTVALKVPNPRALVSPDSRARFEREAQAAAVLSHPSIVPVFESGNVGPISYIAYEFCSGKTLAEWFENCDRTVSPQTAARIVSQLADAVQHAHQRGIIHRDLKPGNVMVKVRDSADTQEFCITDFGLARNELNRDSFLTLDGAVIGTPAYMSPEQARGSSQTGPATDIYSLGVILYELLSGRLPHKKETHLATIQATETDEPPRLPSSIPRDLAAICFRCLGKQPQHRYRSAHDLSVDLNSWSTGRPVAARHATSIERLIRWVQRKPTLASSLFLAILGLVCGASVASWQWYRASANLSVAKSENRRAENYLAQMTDIVDRVLSDLEQQDEPSLITESEQQWLNQIVKIQRELIEENQTRPSIQANTLRAYWRLGTIFKALGDLEGALKVASEANEKLLPVSNSAPRDKSVIESVLKLYLLEVELHHRCNRANESLELISLAAALFESQHDLFSEPEQLAHRLQINNFLGLALLASGRHAESRKAHETARNWGEQLLLTGLATNADMRLITANLVNLATDLRNNREFDKSSETSKSAASLIEPVLEQHPEDVQAKRLLAITYSNWSSCLWTLNQRKRAAANAQLAVTLWEQLVDDVPRNSEYLESLAVAYNRLARYLADRGDRSLAINQKSLDLEKRGLSQSLKGKYTLVSALVSRGYLLIQLDRDREALEIANRAIELGTTFFSEESDYVPGITAVTNAWQIRLQASKSLERGDRFLQLAPDYYEVTRRLLQANPPEDTKRRVVEHLVWTFRNESIYLAKSGLWEKAIVSLSRTLSVGNQTAELNYVRAARSLAIAVNELEKEIEVSNNDENKPGLELMKQQGLRWLESAIDRQGFNKRKALETNSVWTPLRSHPEFQSLTERIR